MWSFYYTLITWKCIRKYPRDYLLQANLTTFHKWCHNNHTELNVTKCHVTGHNKIKILYNYNLEGNNITSVELINFGILCDTKLKQLGFLNIPAINFEISIVLSYLSTH